MTGHECENSKNTVLEDWLRKHGVGEKQEPHPLSLTKGLESNPEIRKKFAQKREEVLLRCNAVMFHGLGREKAVDDFCALYGITDSREESWASLLVYWLSYESHPGSTAERGPSDEEEGAWGADIFRIWEKRLETEAVASGHGDRYRRVRGYVGEYFGWRAHALYNLEKNVTDFDNYSKKVDEFFGGVPLPEAIDQFANKYSVTEAEMTAYVREMFMIQFQKKQDFRGFEPGPWFGRFSSLREDNWAQETFKTTQPWDAYFSSPSEIRSRMIAMGPVSRFDDLFESFKTEFDGAF